MRFVSLERDYVVESLGQEFDFVSLSLLSLVATLSILRVNVDELKSAEGRQHLAVVHALEDGDELVLGKDQSHRLVVHLALVFALIPLKVLVDPETTVGLLLVIHFDKLLAKSVVEVLGSLISHGVGPVEDFLVHVAALGEFVIKSLEVSIGLTGSDVDRCAALQLDAHGGGSDGGLSKIELVEGGVPVLGD